MDIDIIKQKLQEQISFYEWTDNPKTFSQISDNGAKAALIVFKESIGLSLSSYEYNIRCPKLAMMIK